ncbi:MAG: DUF2784 domain-containing protein [Sedimenticolaceae bacterium]
MGYRILADLVVLAHFGFIVFVLLGGLLAFRWHWIPWLHIPALAWGGFVELTGRICPLTPLENSLRRAGGLTDYSQSFIERYVVPVVYPEELTQELQVLMGSFLIVLNILIYACVVWRRRNRVLK